MQLSSREQFFKKAKDSGLVDAQIYKLYALMRKSCILYVYRKNGSADDRRRIDKDIMVLLQQTSGSPCVFFKQLNANIQEGIHEIKIQANVKKYSAHALDRAILDFKAETYFSVIRLGKCDEEKLDKAILRLDQRRKRMVGSRAWKFGLLGGVTAALISAGIYYSRQTKKTEVDKEKK
jgi:hypothetical protein